MARAVVRSVCAGRRIPAGLVDDAALVAAVLVATTVRRSRADIRLLVQVDHQAVTIQVDDRNTALPIQDERAAAGWSLDIVERLTRTWGFHRTVEGWRVWAVLDPAVEAEGGSPDGVGEPWRVCRYA